VRAQFDIADHMLLPGMFADVTVNTGAPADVLAVPRTAVVYGLYGDNAFVVVPAPSGDGLVVDRRLIRLGATRGERIAIVDGLKVGDKVVIAGQIKLQPKSPVVIDQVGALPPPVETPRP
jgi:multidrug efflux pump subunit AcrA (membrane-fusion protein)